MARAGRAAGELEQVGTPWWPGNRRRRTALEARIAERTQVVARLDADVAQADEALAALTRQDQAAQEVWTAVMP
jgi:hypothetical protein